MYLKLQDEVRQQPDFLAFKNMQHVISEECATFLDTKLAWLPQDKCLRTREVSVLRICCVTLHPSPLCSVPGRLSWASFPSGSSVVPPARHTGDRSKSEKRGVDLPSIFPSES